MILKEIDKIEISYQKPTLSFKIRGIRERKGI
jgi:hypothetical protein